MQIKTSKEIRNCTQRNRTMERKKLHLVKAEFVYVRTRSHWALLRLQSLKSACFPEIGSQNLAIASGRSAFYYRRLYTSISLRRIVVIYTFLDLIK